MGLGGWDRDKHKETLYDLRRRVRELEERLGETTDEIIDLKNRATFMEFVLRLMISKGGPNA